jgi:putative transposase
VLEERQRMIADIEEARRKGARLARACAVIGLSLRTYRRWTRGSEVQTDARPDAERPEPSHKLSVAEREAILTVCHEARFASLPPSQIVPRLADEGCYLGSESSFYRLLHEADQQHHRGRAGAPQRREPATHQACGPHEVWCWDVSYLPSGICGLYFYLYLILDLYSRKIVGWEVQAEESGEHGAALVRRTALSEGIATYQQPLVLHADNGSPMKSSTLLATLQWLGVQPSHSRPRVSNDNAYAESLFRTCKYRPDYPAEGFGSLEEARTWMQHFVQWYNTEHRHSGLNFVTPVQRHTREAETVMRQRLMVYEDARARHPRRWSRSIRNWTLPSSVWLNPLKQDAQEMTKAA